MQNRFLMCDPEFFRVDYVINPWMQTGSVDAVLAQKQWHSLKSAYESLGCVVDVIAGDPKYPDMVFSADQGIVVGQDVVLSSFCYPERQGETSVYKLWFENRGMKTKQIKTGCFEGGEVLQFRKQYLIGTGFRAKSNVVLLLSKALGIPITELKLVDPRFYHLDTCLFVLNDKIIFYYKAAFAHESVEWLQKNVPLLIELEENEADQFAANSVVVGKTVVCQAENPMFEAKLKKFGFMPNPLEMSEFKKSGGGIHCLTLALG